MWAKCRVCSVLKQLIHVDITGIKTLKILNNMHKGMDVKGYKHVW